MPFSYRPVILAALLGCLSLPAVSPAAFASENLPLTGNSKPQATPVPATPQGTSPQPEIPSRRNSAFPRETDAGKTAGKTSLSPEKTAVQGQHDSQTRAEPGRLCVPENAAGSDRAAALARLEQAAKAGDVPAMNELGDGCEKARRNADALYWYEKSAAKNDPEGQYQLAGLLLVASRPDAKTARRAFGLISRAAARNHAKAQFRLAEIYRYGDLAEPDAGKALFWYRRSAAQQYLPALTELADIYENGLMDQAADPVLAAQLRHAIGHIAGTPTPEPEGKLADTLATVWDTIKPFSLLLLFLLFPILRARARYRTKQIESGMRLFENGDYELAAPFLMKPYIGKYPEGEAMLGEMLARGLGVEKNVAEAMPHLTRPSGENGRAAYLVGALFENGDGVSQDDREAFFWYERGAQLGDSDAMNRLGLLYAEGRGVKQDNEKAVEWLEKSAETGCENAQTNLASIRNPGR